MKVQAGKTYNVNHSRKGKFAMLATTINGEWIKGNVIEGQAQAMCHYNVKDVGDEVTVRESFCTFEEIVIEGGE